VHLTGLVPIAPFLREYVTPFVMAVSVQLKGTAFSASITHLKILTMPVYVVLCGKALVAIRLYKSTVLIHAIPVSAAKDQVRLNAKAVLIMHIGMNSEPVNVTLTGLDLTVVSM